MQFKIKSTQPIQPPALEQYLILTEDEEIAEDEDLMTDMFQVPGFGWSGWQQ